MKKITTNATNLKQLQSSILHVNLCQKLNTLNKMDKLQ